eukprot:TRINITY_DN15551_c0_g2_i1.p1 TRINITY_DN15551_c0_g2~~TRINITY_DN15551_c0_g2_i1.p1  ORF type:complete len:119 (-),score=15.57 TRINITY_DN15551_c0_g2_i1:643-999(-)
MESFFNDGKISGFLENYPCAHWVSILKSLVHHSIDSIRTGHPDRCPTLEELFKFLGENSAKGQLLKKFANLYTHLHRVDRAMKRMLKHNGAQYESRRRAKSIRPDAALKSVGNWFSYV